MRVFICEGGHLVVAKDNKDHSTCPKKIDVAEYPEPNPDGSVPAVLIIPQYEECGKSLIEFEMKR